MSLPVINSGQVTTAENDRTELCLDEDTLYEDISVKEKTLNECLLKKHHRLQWFWRMLSALHEFGHALLKFPCVSDNDDKDKSFTFGNYREKKDKH